MATRLLSYRTPTTTLALALGLALVALDARSQPMPIDPRLPPPPQLNECLQIVQKGGVKIDLVATATPNSVQLTWQGYPGDYAVTSADDTGFSATVQLSESRILKGGRNEPAPEPQLEQGLVTHSGARADFAYHYSINGMLIDGRVACGGVLARTPPAPPQLIALPKVPRVPKGPRTVCEPGAAVGCQPALAGACGQKICAADASAFGACMQVSCGACAPGSKKACDYQGSAGQSHCPLGERTCNVQGSGFGACNDSAYRCGNWSSIDAKECASTGVAKHAGILANIPSGDDRKAYVLNHPATVFGVQMNAKAYVTDLWGNAWGSFAVPNTSCFVYNLTYLKSCTSPVTGTVIYLNPNTGKTFRESASIPCLSNCFGSNERKVYSSEPNWGNEPFPLIGGGGGPARCETLIVKSFEW